MDAALAWTIVGSVAGVVAATTAILQLKNERKDVSPATGTSLLDHVMARLLWRIRLRSCESRLECAVTMAKIEAGVRQAQMEAATSQEEASASTTPEELS